jgi:hypothetical protein
MDLFIAPNLEFQKVAAEVSLPEDPNTWPTEILQELHKHIPYIADFDPRIVMDRVDAERGYALGHIEVMNKTQIQASDPNTLEAAGVNEVRIPIVVRNNKLMPFDVLVTADSKILPLTEQRLRMALFRPQMFDTTAKSPGDQSMVSMLYPPYRQSGGMAGMELGTKMGSARPSLLAAILPTIEERHFSSFGEKLASDRGLQAAYGMNPASKGALELLSNYEPGRTAKTAAAVSGLAKPTVAQLAHTTGGYVVKMASSHLWDPSSKIVDRGRAIQAFGEKIVLAADMNGSVTMAEGATVSEEDPMAEKSEVVTQYGIYKCQGNDGREHVGFVFPNLIDSTGLPTSTMLFTNGSQTACQAEIAGIRVGDGAAMFEGRGPKGVGAFYRVNEGKTECTIPFKVTGQISAQGEVGFACETFDGRPVKLVVQSGLQDVTESEPGVTLIPDSFRWMPLEQAESVTLVGAAEDLGKEASATRHMGSVVIRAGGHDVYTLEGPAVSKLASAEREFISYDDALFVLAGLGVKPEYAQVKLAQSIAFQAPISIRVGREIKTASERKTAALKSAHAFLAKIPDLRRDLFKEAAALPDPTAVDTVLSMGFLNPENIMTFVSYLPQIDQSQSKLCELLLAARLGLKEVTTSALERAIKATEEVVEGLRVLAFQKT